MLTVRNLSKIYGKGTVNQKIALDSLSLEVKPNEFITVIGSNGAGKSTLLNCIAGVDPVDSGTISLNGTDLTPLPEHRRSRMMGRVFQDPMKGTAFDMTIEQNLAIAACKNRSRFLQPGITHRERKEFQERLALLDMGLENRMKEKVRFLSGGQRQALTLFMATLTHPSLLLLDEHTAALDPGTAKKVLELTDRVAENPGMCTLMITHNMSDALLHGSRTILMDSGRILMDIQGEERKAMTVEKLIHQFELENDRMLFG